MNDTEISVVTNAIEYELGRGDVGDDVYRRAARRVIKDLDRYRKTGPTRVEFVILGLLLGAVTTVAVILVVSM